MTESSRRTTLIMINDPPYGTERAYNTMRLANALSKGEDDEVRIFLIGDAAACARRGQQTPNGFYNVERMLKIAARQGAAIGV